MNDNSAIGRLCEKCDGKWSASLNCIHTFPGLMFSDLALYVIPMCAQKPLYEYVTSATLGHMVDVV